MYAAGHKTINSRPSGAVRGGVDRGQPRDDLRLAPTDMSGTRHGRATDMRLEAASASHRSSSARRAAALSLAGGDAAAATYSSAAS